MTVAVSRRQVPPLKGASAERSAPRHNAPLPATFDAVLRAIPAMPLAFVRIAFAILAFLPHRLQALQAVTPPPPTQRLIVDPHWVALWRTRGGPAEDLFGVPRHLLAAPDGVLVLDEGTLQLSSFSQLGERRWTVGRKGKGPGEFARPIDLAFLPDGDIAVLDVGNGRVSVFAASGIYRRSVAIPNAATALSLCATRDGALHFINGEARAFITTLSATGIPRRTLPFPWPLQPNTPSLVHSATFARGTVSDDCAFATTFGFGIGHVGTSAPMQTSSFVEALALPTIRRDAMPDHGTRQTVSSGDNASLAAFRSGDTMLVSFAGRGANKYAILDLYDRAGRYLVSWPLPSAAWVSYRDGWLWSIVNPQESPTLIAYVPAADTTALFKRWPHPRRAGPPINRR
jgi:hypothetical protein